MGELYGYLPQDAEPHLRGRGREFRLSEVDERPLEVFHDLFHSPPR